MGEAKLKKVCEAMLGLLGLSEQKNVAASALSGGMKRRLSTGIALIGNPEVVLLDEPSAGLDPIARRRLWNVLLSIMPNRGILLATHSMEEVDVLSHRVGILIRGSLKCIGTPHTIKYKFGR